METVIQISPRVRAGMLALLALFFAFGLFDHSLWSSNDTREGAMIAAMARGGSWTLPQLNGEPYLEKPPLLHWTGAALCRLTGVVNEGLVRLPAVAMQPQSSAAATIPESPQLLFPGLFNLILQRFNFFLIFNLIIN